MKIQYLDKNFSVGTLSLIQHAEDIINEYSAQGYILTVRQVYYQFVARNLIPNEEKWYKRIVRTVSDARLTGLLDWDSIEDRTRYFRSLSTWGSPKGILRSVTSNYRIDMWENQPCRVEVWIEKDALIGVISRVCERLRISYFSCRGYASQSALWRAAQRIIYQEQEAIILHLGDHDPSGIDMTRDITERLEMFAYDSTLKVKRIALNMNQIEKYKPPPNPTKLTDTRAREYIRKWGNTCYELDALNPETITSLIESHVLEHRDPDLWKEDTKKEQADIEKLNEIINNLD